MALDITVIRTAARAGRITWRYHALLRAEERGMTRAQATQVLIQGEIIEQRPRAKLFPSVYSWRCRKTTDPCTSLWATTHPTTASMSLPSTGSTRASGKTHGAAGEDNHDNHDNQCEQSTLCCLWW